MSEWMERLPEKNIAPHYLGYNNACHVDCIFLVHSEPNRLNLTIWMGFDSLCELHLVACKGFLFRLVSYGFFTHLVLLLTLSSVTVYQFENGTTNQLTIIK